MKHIIVELSGNVHDHFFVFCLFIDVILIFVVYHIRKVIFVVKRTGDRRTRKTKQSLLESFSKLLEKKELKEISVQELTDLADLNRTTFYLHYKDIYDLQRQIEDDTIGEITTILNEYMPTPDARDPYPLFVALLNYCRNNESLCRMLLSKNSGPGFLDKICAMVEQICVQSWFKMFNNGGHDERLSYYSLYTVRGYVAVISKWVASGMRLPPEELAKMMENIVLYGIGFLEH